MAGAFGKYQAEVEKFKNDYGVNFTFERYEKEVKGRKSDPRPENAAYKGVFLSLYREAIDNRITKRSDKMLDPLTFFHDFEMLMNNYRDHCKGTGRNAPDPNGGWKDFNEVADAMQDEISDIKPVKAEYVQDLYRERKLRLRDMRKDLNEMKNSKPLSAEALSRVFAYRRALQRVVDDRRESFWDRARNWIQFRAEKRELKAMNAFIDQNRNSDIYKQAGAFDDEDIVTEAKESLTSAKENIVLAEKLEKERELERIRAREKELEAKRDAKTKAEKLMENSTQAEAIKKEILAIFDKTKMNSGLKKLACDAVYKSSVDSVKAIWNAVDGKSGDDLETALKSGMEDMFIGTHTFIFPFFDQQNGLVEAQKITDMMLKQFSPIAFDEKLAKYGDSYFINHTSVETIGRLAKIDDFEVARSLLIDAKDALKNDRVNLDLSADFVEKDNGEKKSPKIEEPTAPTLGTNVKP